MRHATKTIASLLLAAFVVALNGCSRTGSVLDHLADGSAGAAGHGAGGAGGGAAGAGGSHGDGAADARLDAPDDSSGGAETGGAHDGGSDADANADAGTHTTHIEGQSCDDGLGCTPGLVCKAIGDPCPTYPNCKICYLPCGADGGCPSTYRFCFPPSGQGGDVCFK